MQSKPAVTWLISSVWTAVYLHFSSLADHSKTTSDIHTALYSAHFNHSIGLGIIHIFRLWEEYLETRAGTGRTCLLHTERRQLGLNQESCCCEVTVLTTAAPCCQKWTKKRKQIFFPTKNVLIPLKTKEFSIISNTIHTVFLNGKISLHCNCSVLWWIH